MSQVFRGIHTLTQRLSRPVVTIGNFDGVHLGHQEILRQTQEKARARGGVPVAYTFRPHPRIALNPEHSSKLILTYDEKLEILSELGMDVIVEEPFSREFSTTSPEKFFKEGLIERLGAQAIVVGYDFGFGQGRAGGLEALKKLSQASNVELTVVPPLMTSTGSPISSSEVRRLLLAGKVDEAEAILGRSYFYRGVVIRGDQRGRKIGFPTANLSPGEKVVVEPGVYATWAVIGRGSKPLASVTNVGVRPTFQKAGELPPIWVETHLLEQDVDLYGLELEVRFVKRLRNERKFSGVEELTSQIASDLGAARLILGA
jgi:riboflavin kinase / FMN adenylyltransferase